MRRTNRKRRGFTIAEILIAIMVITVAILGTVAAIAYGLRASRLGSDNTVAIQVNRKALELILQGIYPSVTSSSPQFNHPPGDPLVDARGTNNWRPVYIVTQTTPQWFTLADYGFLDGTPDAERFKRDTLRSELNVSSQAVDSVPSMKADTRFQLIVVQTRWQDKNASWRFVRTETYGLPEGD